MQRIFCQIPQVPVRMGLHIGDIIFDDEQVVGDGVNLASRIESLGVARMCIAFRQIHDEIRNHPD